MDLETRTRHTQEARATAGWVTALVMFAAFAYGVATEDETGYWLLFVVATVGIGAFLAIDHHLDALKLAVAAVRSAQTDELRRQLEARAPAPSAFESPAVVGSVIGFAGVVVGAIMSFG